MAALMAVIPVETGWVALHLAALRPHGGLVFAFMGMVLMMPGVIFAGFLGLLSSTGVHNMELSDWLIVPVSWIFYFLLFSGWLGRMLSSIWRFLQRRIDTPRPGASS